MFIFRRGFKRVGLINKMGTSASKQTHIIVVQSNQDGTVAVRSSQQQGRQCVCSRKLLYYNQKAIVPPIPDRLQNNPSLHYRVDQVNTLGKQLHFLVKKLNGHHLQQMEQKTIQNLRYFVLILIKNILYILLKMARCTM